MTEKKENTNKPCPRWLSWPWNVILYVALFLVLRIFAIPFIVLLIYLRGRYSPHGGAEGYCLSRTRRRLVWLIPGVILLALGGVAIYLTLTVAPKEDLQDRLMVGGLGALALLIGICLSVVGVRDTFFPEKSRLAQSIRDQLPFPDEAPGVAALFAMVDDDLAKNGTWFGPVGVGNEWVLGSEASYIPRICGIFVVDRIRRTGAGEHRRNTREMALILIDDEWRMSRTDFRVSPKDLHAAADYIALRSPDARRGVNDEYEQFLSMDEEAQEQFLQARRRRQGTRTAEQAQSDRRAELQSMVLIRADGSRTSLVTPALLHQTLEEYMEQGEGSFSLTPTQSLAWEGGVFQALECGLWPEEDQPADLLLQYAAEDGGPPREGLSLACSLGEAEHILGTWLQGRLPDLTNWEPVRLGVPHQPAPKTIPARLLLVTSQGLRQSHDTFTSEDVAVSADGLAEGRYRSVEVSLPGGYLMMRAVAGDQTDGRCTVIASRADPDTLRFFQIQCDPRQAARWLKEFAAGTFHPDWKGWKDVTKRLLPKK